MLRRKSTSDHLSSPHHAPDLSLPHADRAPDSPAVSSNTERQGALAKQNANGAMTPETPWWSGSFSEDDDVEQREASGNPTNDTQSTDAPDEAPSFAPASGPTHNAELDGALTEAFGTSLTGLSASFGDTTTNQNLGAEAHAEGSHMSFGGGIKPDAPARMRPDDLDTIAHEIAHALQAVGSGNDGVDVEGDAGETAADHAGASFSQWATGGFAGPAPSLHAAPAGDAAIHRKATAGSTRVTGNPALRTGSRGGPVSTLQTLLRRHGMKVQVDGVFGPGTEAAVRAFQQRQGLSIDGVVGPATAARLNGGSAPSKPSADLSKALPLRQGAKGAVVVALQKRLNQHGARLSTDGQFGQGTYQAVVAFQAANGLTADGIVGPATAARLQSGKAKPIGAGGGGGDTSKMPGRYLGKFSAYRNGRYIGKMDVVQMDGKKLALKVARAWDRLKKAAARDGVRLHLNSGFRTMAEQKVLYRKYLDRKGNLAAAPGWSNHQNGIAVDIDVTSRASYRWMHRRAPSFGFRRTVPSEPWHWEYFGR